MTEAVVQELRWRLIDDFAYQGQPVWLRCSSRPEYGAHLLMWDAKAERWWGYQWAPMRRNRIVWDEELPQPTHYAVPVPHV